MAVTDRETKRMYALRILPSVKAQIDERRAAHQLNFTDYMVQCALGQIVDPRGIEIRLEELEGRMKRLEELASLG